MAIIANIVQLIRTATYGKDMRESIASGIEAINTEVESTTARQATVEGRQDDVEETFQEVINLGGNPSAEVVQARQDTINNVTYDNLQARMDGVSSSLAEKVNQADLDIANANIALKANNTDSNRTTTDKTVTGAINELNNNKAEKTEVNSLATLKADISYVETKTQGVSLAYKESYATLADLQTAYPTGDTYNHVVLTDGLIYTWKSSWVSTSIQANGTGVANNSVTQKKTNFVVDKKRNLVNLDNIVYDKSINFNDDVISNTTGYFYTDYTEIDINYTKITCNLGVSTSVMFYDENKVFISGNTINYGATPNRYVSIPANARYFRLSTQTSYLANLCVSYGERGFFEINAPKYKFVNENISVVKTSISSNLFDKTSIVNGYNINSSTNIISAITGYFYNDYFYIDANKKYISANALVNMLFYDKYLNFISGYIANYNGSKPYTSIPTNAKYMIISGSTSILDTLMVAYGNNTPITYEAYSLGYFMENIKHHESIYSNVKILFIGDSLTHGEDGNASPDYSWSQRSFTFARYVQKILGCNFISEAGYPGASASSYYGLMTGGSYPFTVSDYDVIVIMLGTNQGLTDTLVTDVEPYTGYVDYANTNTGNYCKIIEYCLSQNPNAQIILMTPPYGNDNAGRVTLLESARDVIFKIRERYNLEVIDLYKESGMSEFTKATMQPHDGLHFSRIVGYPRLGSFIAGKLKSCLSWIVG